MKKVSTTVVTWVGLEAHKKFITVAQLTGDAREPEHWQIDNTERTIRRLARKLRRDAGDGEVPCCYEAGPLGFTLQRRLLGSGQPPVSTEPHRRGSPECSGPPSLQDSQEKVHNMLWCGSWSSGRTSESRKTSTLRWLWSI